ncbi:MAG: hypothetical protein ACRDTA_12735 [Pseudonocardiaceae bacterium]
MRRSVQPPLTGVVARLERAGYLCRQSDPDDGRRQLLRPAPGGIAEVFAGRQSDSTVLVAGFGHRAARGDRHD